MADYYDYHYNRPFEDGVYKINNPDRTTGDPPVRLFLADEIATALPGKTFCVCCNNSDCRIRHQTELTTEEEATQASVVAAHIANT